MIYIILMLSYLLEASFSNIVSKESIFVPLFLLTSLTILYPYFKNIGKFNFIITSVICGFIYDISFTNSIFINTLSFGFASGFIILIYNYINYNICSSNFLNIVVLIFYRIISYILLCIIDFVKFNEMSLLKGIYSSLIFNVIYGIIIFIIVDLLAKIFNIKRVE